MYNWAKRHINLTWVFFGLLLFSTIFFSTPLPYMVAYALLIVATFWGLHQKGRCWAWFIFPISVLFLENQKDMKGE